MHSDYERFFILSSWRSGTNYLRSLLNAHPKITAFGELFNTGGYVDWDIPPKRRSSGGDLVLRKTAPIEFLNTRVFTEYPEHTKAVGFKLLYNQKGASFWKKLQAADEYRVIHLKRRNILRSYLSLRRAWITRRWEDRVSIPEEFEPLKLKYDDCLEYFVVNRRAQLRADAAFEHSTRLDIYYEDLVDRQAIETRRVQEFLGVDGRTVEAKLFKQNKQPLSESIANYFELKAKFRNTQFYKFFED